MVTINNVDVSYLWDRGVQVWPVPKTLLQKYERLHHLSGGELLVSAIVMNKVMKIDG